MFVIGTYVESIGACRGGDSPGNFAGGMGYWHRDCKNLCDDNFYCGGYALRTGVYDWCETYTSKGVTGDGQTDYKCFKKSMKYILLIKKFIKNNLIEFLSDI